jgi:CDP-diacylglycerol--glycerol-3-phosphate 3-phosphatidyltransferase
MNWRKHIPWSMVFGRALLGPAIAIVAALLDFPEPWIGLMILAGFFADVYDGILARRWGTETSALRIGDSAADTIFYLGILAAALERAWPVLRARLVLIAALLALEVLRWSFDWLKYRRMASYHTYASKFWGILLAAASLAVLSFHGPYWMLTLALIWGILCDLEGLVISLLLPVWTRDVRTLRSAWVLRRQMLAGDARIPGDAR